MYDRIVVVTLAPEDNKIIVFKSGNPQGLIASMQERGQIPPNMLNTGAKEEEKMLKKTQKNITLETIKRVIPMRIVLRKQLLPIL